MPHVVEECDEESGSQNTPHLFLFLEGCILKCMIVHVDCQHFLVYFSLYFFNIQVALIKAECAQIFELIAATLPESIIQNTNSFISSIKRFVLVSVTS